MHIFWLSVLASMMTADDFQAEQQATPASAVVVPSGFQVELLRSARADEGSWISMTFDHRGRLIFGRDDAGLMRVTLADSPDAANPVARMERLDDTLKHCRGVLYAFDSLYVSATNSNGFYRLTDTDNDDQFDQVTLLKSMD
ncbi:MAG: hypothetical protein KDA96_22675, partial [Planctomycetaceae bacterium]|nr:hypothetical protein [Planctomycetaceae bacterium]